MHQIHLPVLELDIRDEDWYTGVTIREKAYEEEDPQGGGERRRDRDYPVYADDSYLYLKLPKDLRADKSPVLPGLIDVLVEAGIGSGSLAFMPPHLRRLVSSAPLIL